VHAEDAAAEALADAVVIDHRVEHFRVAVGKDRERTRGRERRERRRHLRKHRQPAILVDERILRTSPATMCRHPSRTPGSPR
jgi:hypothetical protein